MEFVYKSLDNSDIFKYVDDLILEEKVSEDIPCLVDLLGYRPLHLFGAQKIQQGFNKLQEACSEKGLRINEKKTQLISISSAKYDTKAWIEQKNAQPIYSESNFKLLGFHFNSKPNVHLQIDKTLSTAQLVELLLYGVKVDMSRLINILSSQKPFHCLNP